MVEPLKWFIKTECLHRNAGEVIDSLSNKKVDGLENYLNENVTKLTRTLFSRKISTLSKSIFTDVDKNNDKTATKEEILKYLKRTYNISEQELMNMNVEQVIMRIDKYLKEHPENKPEV